MKRLLLLCLVLTGTCIRADIIEHIGSYSGWSSVDWQVLASLNDPADGANTELDFVGDSSAPGAFWGMDDDYVYFRMRLDVATAASSTFRDSHFVLIDVEGYGNDLGLPDFGFAWDSKSNDPTQHGLEMMVLDTAGTTWGSITMDDIDGSNSKKLVNDINGVGRTTDGYLRSVDGQLTSNFGNTTFLDFGVALSYMNTHVPELMTNGSWKVQFASLPNATDHNSLSEDIAGGNSPSSTVSLGGWSESIAIPEPATISLIVLFGGGLLASKRILSS